MDSKEITTRHRPPLWLAAGLFMDLAAGLLRVLSRSAPGFADRYADLMNPVLVNTLGRVSGLFPFSLAELLLAGLIAGLILYVIRTLLFARRPGVLRTRLVSLGKFLFVFLSVLFLLFHVNEDVYFARTRFAVRYGLERDSYTTEELSEVCRYLVEEINRTSPLVLRDQEGHMITGLPAPETSAAAGTAASAALPDRMRSAMMRLGETYPELSGWYPRPKPVCCSTLLSRGDITGVYSMFTVEANINRDMPAYNTPFTMGHELSHLKGFESEKEANFLGYLSCITSEDPDLHYSGAMLGWVYCGNELHKRDYSLWYQLYTSLDPQADADLRDNNDYWDRYRGKVSETVQDLNDAYLKAEGLPEGTLSYDLVTDMIVTYELMKENKP